MPFITPTSSKTPPTHFQALILSLTVGLSVVGVFGYALHRHGPEVLDGSKELARSLATMTLAALSDSPQTCGKDPGPGFVPQLAQIASQPDGLPTYQIVVVDRAGSDPKVVISQGERLVPPTPTLASGDRTIILPLRAES